MKKSKLVLLYKQLLQAMTEEEHITEDQEKFLINVMDDFFYDKQLCYSLENLFEHHSYLIKDTCIIGVKK